MSERVPVIAGTLAKEFALLDRFFASHPGSTYPNRQFVLSGTARGMLDTGDAVHAACGRISGKNWLFCFFVRVWAHRDMCKREHV